MALPETDITPTLERLRDLQRQCRDLKSVIMDHKVIDTPENDCAIIISNDAAELDLST